VSLPKNVLASIKSAAKQTTKRLVKNAQSAASKLAQNVKPAAAKVLCPLKRFYSANETKLDFAREVVLTGIEWGAAKVGTTKYGTFTLKGVKEITLSGVKASPVPGQFGGPVLFKKLAGQAPGITTLIGPAIALGKEALQQWKAGKFDGARLAAVGGVELAKAAVGQVAFAGGVALVASAGAVGFAPIAAGIVAAYLVGKLLDKADDKWGLTDKAANSLRKIF
jgi:hypothetical protein